MLWMWFIDIVISEKERCTLLEEQCTEYIRVSNKKLVFPHMLCKY